MLCLLPRLFAVVLAALRKPALSAKLRSVGIRCLIVDDNEDFLASAALLLRSQGIEVLACASSGAEALKLAEDLRPDVALVDVELGEEDGVELTRELARRAPSTRVVLISVHERDDLADLIRDSVAVGFLPKRALGASAIEGVLA
jgi:DNA-binding NarL/FixJ family response regulator